MLFDYVLSLIPNHEKEYCSADSIDKSDELLNPVFALLPPEFLYSLQKSGIPNDKLKLKVGTPIMLLRNLARLMACAMELGSLSPNSDLMWLRLK